MSLDQLITLQPCVFGQFCCNTRRCNFRRWNLGRETAPRYNNKATQNPTVLDVRPSAYTTTPTYRSARAWDTTINPVAMPMQDLHAATIVSKVVGKPRLKKGK